MDLKNTKSLVEPKNLKWKVLLVGRPGVGKTSWLATAPDIGVCACETGHGSGLLTAAHSSIDYVEPKTFTDLRSICLNTFAPFQGKQSVGLDSLTAMTKGFIKDHCLSAFPPKNRTEAMRRQAGVPSGFDYSDFSEVTRTLLNYILAQDKNVVVTALEKTEKDEGGAVVSIGPDLPGALSAGAAALFDTVLYLKVRRVLRDPRDPKSVVYERYLVTGADGIHISKDRNNIKGKPFLAPEEIFDLDTGKGSFPHLFNKILAGHAAAQQVHSPQVATSI